MKNILCVVPYPHKTCPSTRFRIKLYQSVLEENGYQYDIVSFWGDKGRQILYQKGKFFAKVLETIKGFLGRIKILFIINRYDYLFIIREVTPIGLPIFEWIFARIFKKKIIYDFDDAIWLEFGSRNNKMVKFFKTPWKVKVICKLSHKVSAGNRYLYDYAAQYSKNVILNPTCVDTKDVHNKVKNHSIKPIRLTIGWTGQFATLVYLEEIVSVLQELQKKHDFDFLVIADQNPHLHLKNFVFKKWNETSEIEDLLQCDIGVMPLFDSEYAKGKCGFKLIQFMALGIPVVASPVGVNEQIVDESIGFLCKTKEDWFNALELLIVNEELRTLMGKEGRKKMNDYYSLESNTQNMLSLFS